MKVTQTSAETSFVSVNTFNFSHPSQIDVESWNAAQSHHGALSGDHSKRGQTAEILVTLVEEFEMMGVFGAHAHSQSVQNSVHVCVCEAHLSQRLADSVRL